MNKTVLAVLAGMLAGGGAIAAYQTFSTPYAEVVSSKPITEKEPIYGEVISSVAVTETRTGSRQVCEDQVVEKRRPERFGDKDGAVVGALVGGLLGNQIGKGLDKADRLEAERAAQDTLESAPSGVERTWHNPDSGNSGSFVAKPAYTESGAYCREFTQTVNIDGRSERAFGTACRQPDGTWKMVA